MTFEHFTELWEALILIFAIGTPTVGHMREDHEGPWPIEDEVTRYLTEKGLALGTGDDGVVHVECPWKADHTTPNTLTGTSYFAGGGFKCLHSHCADRTVHEFLDAIGWMTDGFEDISNDDGASAGPSPRAAYQLLTADDLAKRSFTSWCIKGILPKTGLAAIYGPSGSGKSFLVIDMAMALSSGGLWFKLRTKKCPVVYCALEGEGGVAQRVAAYRAQHGDVGEDMRFLLQPFNLLWKPDVEALAKAIMDSGCGGGVTILDTLNRAAPGTDENDSKDMGLIIAGAKRLQELIGGLVILVHHTGKDLSKGLRGHSSLLAVLDCAIELSRGGDVRSWSVAKSKDGLDGTANFFRLDVVELGKDEDGDPITSCVISPEWDGGSTVHKVKHPRGANQKIILKAIRECLQTNMSSETENRPESAPANGSCIKLEDAVEKTRDRLTCQPDQRDRSTRKAIAGLVNLDLLELKEGWLWEP